MSDFRSRLTTYFTRSRNGLDTHRDDIGTLAERKNRILLKAARYNGTEYSTKGYAINYLYKREILMTLLEDGSISLPEFAERSESLTIQNNVEDQRQLSKQFLNNFNSGVRRIDSRLNLKKRLRDTLLKRVETRLNNE